MSPMMSQILFLVVFIAIMYMLLIRPQRKKEKAVNLMRNSIQVGDEVITIGGICGKVVKTKDDSLIIQVGADKTKFEVMRWAISKVVESSGRASAPPKSRPVEEEEEQKKSLPKRMKKASAANDEGTEDESARPAVKLEKTDKPAEDDDLKAN